MSPEKYQWTLENYCHSLCFLFSCLCTAPDTCLFASRTRNNSALFMTESHFLFYLFICFLFFCFIGLETIKLYLFSLVLNMQSRLVS